MCFLLSPEYTHRSAHRRHDGFILKAACFAALGNPATKHQKELLAGKQRSGEPETTGSTAGAVEPTSPHQEQVTGKRSTQSAEHASQLMAEARKMSEAGDEQGCMKRLAELKDILRVK